MRLMCFSPMKLHASQMPSSEALEGGLISYEAWLMQSLGLFDMGHFANFKVLELVYLQELIRQQEERPRSQNLHIHLRDIKVLSHLYQRLQMPMARVKHYEWGIVERKLWQDHIVSSVHQMPGSVDERVIKELENIYISDRTELSSLILTNKDQAKLIHLWASTVKGFDFKADPASERLQVQLFRDSLKQELIKEGLISTRVQGGQLTSIDPLYEQNTKVYFQALYNLQTQSGRMAKSYASPSKENQYFSISNTSIENKGDSIEGALNQYQEFNSKDLLLNTGVDLYLQSLYSHKNAENIEDFDHKQVLLKQATDLYLQALYSNQSSENTLFSTSISSVENRGHRFAGSLYQYHEFNSNNLLVNKGVDLYLQSLYSHNATENIEHFDHKQVLLKQATDLYLQALNTNYASENPLFSISNSSVEDRGHRFAGSLNQYQELNSKNLFLNTGVDLYLQSLYSHKNAENNQHFDHKQVLLKQATDLYLQALYSNQSSEKPLFSITNTNIEKRGHSFAGTLNQYQEFNSKNILVNKGVDLYLQALYTNHTSENPHFSITNASIENRGHSFAGSLNQYQEFNSKNLLVNKGVDLYLQSLYSHNATENIEHFDHQQVLLKQATDLYLQALYSNQNSEHPLFSITNASIENKDNRFAGSLNQYQEFNSKNLMVNKGVDLYLQSLYSHKNAENNQHSDHKQVLLKQATNLYLQALYSNQNSEHPLFSITNASIENRGNSLAGSLNQYQEFNYKNLLLNRGIDLYLQSLYNHKNTENIEHFDHKQLLVKQAADLYLQGLYTNHTSEKPLFSISNSSVENRDNSLARFLNQYQEFSSKNLLLNTGANLNFKAHYNPKTTENNQHFDHKQLLLKQATDLYLQALYSNQNTDNPLFSIKNRSIENRGNSFVVPLNQYQEFNSKNFLLNRGVDLYLQSLYSHKNTENTQYFDHKQLLLKQATDLYLQALYSNQNSDNPLFSITNTSIENRGNNLAGFLSQDLAFNSQNLLLKTGVDLYLRALYSNQNSDNHTSSFSNSSIENKGLQVTGSHYQYQEFNSQKLLLNKAVDLYLQALYSNQNSEKPLFSITNASIENRGNSFAGSLNQVQEFNSQNILLNQGADLFLQSLRSHKPTENSQSLNTNNKTINRSQTAYLSHHHYQDLDLKQVSLKQSTDPYLQSLYTNTNTNTSPKPATTTPLYSISNTSLRNKGQGPTRNHNQYQEFKTQNLFVNQTADLHLQALHNTWKAENAPSTRPSDPNPNPNPWEISILNQEFTFTQNTHKNYTADPQGRHEKRQGFFKFQDKKALQLEVQREIHKTLVKDQRKGDLRPETTLTPPQIQQVTKIVNRIVRDELAIEDRLQEHHRVLEQSLMRKIEKAINLNFTRTGR